MLMKYHHQTGGNINKIFYNIININQENQRS